MPSFTLLDDSAASQAQRASRLYTDLQQELCCTDPAGFDAMMARMQDGLDQGLFAVGLFPYELGVALQGLERSAGSQPARILLYRQCRQLDCDQVVAWLTAQLACDEPAGIAQLRSSVGEEQFASAIERIGHYIRDGDTYQVNYTFRYHFKTYGQLCALYLRLRPRQAVPYGALIALPDGSAVLSLSPELFVRNRQGILDARPMKGTAAAFGAGDSLENDRVNRQKSTQLSQDVKNRAEKIGRASCRERVLRLV